MIGAKPDERLRTPMQWSRAHADGFTTGTPWESLQADSATTTVEAEDGDSTSLLGLYRRLIHLRSSLPALGSGTLTPAYANAEGVAAYVRRQGEQRLLVLVNLTSEPVRVAVAADDSVVPHARWRARSVIGAYSVSPVHRNADAHVSAFVLREPLGPYEGRIFELVQSRR